MDGPRQGEQARMHEFLHAALGRKAAGGANATGADTTCTPSGNASSNPGATAATEPSVCHVRIANPLAGSRGTASVPVRLPLTAGAIRAAAAAHLGLHDARDVELVVAGRRLDDDAAAGVAAVLRGSAVQAMPKMTAGQHTNEADAFQSMLKHMRVDPKALERMNIRTMDDMKAAAKGLNDLSGMDLLDGGGARGSGAAPCLPAHLHAMMEQLDHAGAKVEVTVSADDGSERTMLLTPSQMGELLAEQHQHQRERERDAGAAAQSSPALAAFHTMMRRGVAVGEGGVSGGGKRRAPTEVEMRRAQQAVADEIAEQAKAAERRRADNRSTARKLEELRAKKRMAKVRRDRKRKAKQQGQKDGGVAAVGGQGTGSGASAEGAGDARASRGVTSSHQQQQQQQPQKAAKASARGVPGGFAGLKRGFLPIATATAAAAAAAASKVLPPAPTTPSASAGSSAAGASGQFAGFKKGFLF